MVFIYTRNLVAYFELDPIFMVAGVGAGPTTRVGKTRDIADYRTGESDGLSGSQIEPRRPVSDESEASVNHRI